MYLARELENLGEIDVEEQGFLGVGDLYSVLLVGVSAQVDGIHSFRDLFH